MMTRMQHQARRASTCVAVALAAALAACGSGGVRTVTEPANASVEVSRGTEFVVVLQTIGPGEYQSPPSISSDAVRFLDVRQADLEVPAGPTQRFRFSAAARGVAVILFQHTGSNANVVDTVLVR